MIKRKLAFFLTAVMVITMLPMIAMAAEYPDMPNDWSRAALQKAVSNGLLQGSEGKIMPYDKLTRAQMAAMVNRAFGAAEKASLSGYTDVVAGAWYCDVMAKAVHMGTFIGDGKKLNPEGNITRQEAFVALAKAFRLPDGNASSLNSFEDKDSVSSWAAGAVSALKSAGYVSGANGKINPQANITRAEFAQMMDNMLKGYFTAAGTYTSVPGGNVMINTPDVTLKGVTVTGALIIGDGVGDGEVTLDSVTVTGRTVIRGGGVNSVKITGMSNLQNIIIARVDGQVRVYAEDGTEVGEVIVDGRDDVIIEGNVGTVTLAASDVTVTATNAEIDSALIQGENAQIIVAAGSIVKTLTVEGPNASIEVAGSINSVVVNGEGTEVSGGGKVGEVAANVNNVKVTTPNTNVTAAAGTTGVTAGTNNVNAGNTENTSSGNNGGRSGGGGGGGGGTVPTINSLSPSAGPVSGGTTVIIAGTNFTGATAVTFGGTAATSFTINSATRITATSPAHAAGAAIVAVTTSGGSSTNLVNFTYSAGPVVSSVSPAAGPWPGGTSVTITGTGFTGATAVTFGGKPAASFTVNSATQITAVTPVNDSIGAVQVIVTTAHGVSADVVNFNYLLPPSVWMIEPNAGTMAGGTSVTIMGANFTGATAVTFGGTAAISFAVDSDIQITAVAPAHAAGAAQVAVTTAGGTSADAVNLTYVAAPTITSISMTEGPTSGGTEVIITGTGFLGWYPMTVSFGGIQAFFTVDSTTQITAVAPWHDAGDVLVSVTAIGGSSNEVTFTYLPPPAVTSVSPAAGPLAGGTSVTINGAGFTGATAVSFGGTAATSFTVVSDTQITATVPAHAAGAAQVVVTAVNGSSSDVVDFTYLVVPTVTSVSPSKGPAAGGMWVTINGTNFAGSTSVSIGGTAATVAFINYDKTQITAVTPAHAAGAAQVVVTTAGGSSTEAVNFTYVAAPVVVSVSPAAGPIGGGTVIITGTGFTGATSVRFIPLNITSFTVDSDTQITAELPGSAAGYYNVEVTTPDGGKSNTDVVFSYE